MFQSRIHGRGGQGVVTAAEIMSIAAFLDGKFAQAFPMFGSERMGAPVMAFCRIDDRPIRLREPVTRPDALIVQDPTLLHQVDLFSGLQATGFVLINTNRTTQELGLDELLSRLPADHVRTVAASDVALELTGRPLPNVALIGGMAAITGQITLASVQAAVRQKFPGRVGEANAAAAAAVYASIGQGERPAEREAGHARAN